MEKNKKKIIKIKIPYLFDKKSTSITPLLYQWTK